MNPYIKDRVVKKLRYGGYKQIKGSLVSPIGNYRHYGYCALGVVGRACGMSPKELKAIPDYNILYERSGITKKQGERIFSLNDLGHTFNQIADHIETHF